MFNRDSAVKLNDGQGRGETLKSSITANRKTDASPSKGGLILQMTPAKVGWPSGLFFFLGAYNADEVGDSY
jgi:hypothetical protein